jgi:heat shock protein HslJ
VQRILVSVAIALGAILVVACSGPPGNTAALPGTAWTVTTIGGATTIADGPPTMSFGADGVVSGTTGCNTYTGSYKLDGSSITIGPLAMTLMLCQGAAGAQETAFSAAFQKASAWTIGTDGTLTLTGVVDIVAKPSGGG